MNQAIFGVNFINFCLIVKINIYTGLKARRTLTAVFFIRSVRTLGPAEILCEIYNRKKFRTGFSSFGGIGNGFDLWLHF